MTRSSNYFLFTLILLAIAGCATKPKIIGPLQQAQWETKALIKDLKTNKSQSLNIDIYAVKNDRARLEISALMGFQVASLVMDNKDISYAIYPQKKFFYGKNSEEAFSRVINLPLHPMNLINVAFEEPVRGSGWQCAKDQSGQLASCTNAERKMRIVWSGRVDGAKKVLITAPQFEMQWAYQAPQTEVQFKPELFTLRQPNGFKAIQIN
jgi:hypothetical protein